MTSVSGDVVALIAAGGTAAGALIGSAAGGVADFILDRAKERRRALAGARLVRLELSLMASTIRDSEHDSKWWVFSDQSPASSWGRYAESIGPSLTPDEFEAVTQAISDMDRFATHIAGAPKAPDVPYWDLSDKAVSGLQAMRAGATSAYNALANVAKDQPMAPGELLHDDQGPT
jgi:hypothetical protein